MKCILKYLLSLPIDNHKNFLIMKKILLLMAITLPFIFNSCGDDKDEPDTPKKHEWVDLGLPSGTLWATCNVGANAPEEYGDYFAWGETTPKYFYDWNSYKWLDDNYLTKYCTNRDSGKNGFIDGKTELDPEDDAAYINWGKSWRMPSYEQVKELVDKCSWSTITKNGVYGCLGTGPNSNTIFLPAAGYRYEDYLSSAGSSGRYWSRTLSPSDYPRPSFHAYLLRFEDNAYYFIDERDTGRTVRAVRVSKK